MRLHKKGNGSLRWMPAVGLLLVLTACAAPANIQTQLAVACQGYTDALRTLEPFKPQLTNAQLDVIRSSIDVAEPLCTGDMATVPSDALDMVRTKLRELVMLQNEVQP